MSTVVSRLFLTGMALLLASSLAACGDGDAGPDSRDSSPDASPADPPEEPTVLEGSFSVGDYKLHLRCDGSGSPTIVYLHGFSHTDDGGEANASSAATLPEALSPKHRFCAYDRANVGQSGEASGPRTGQSSAHDLAKLLEAA